MEGGEVREEAQGSHLGPEVHRLCLDGSGGHTRDEAPAEQPMQALLLPHALKQGVHILSGRPTLLSRCSLQIGPISPETV